MDLATLKSRLADVEATLDADPLVELCGLETPHGDLSVVISDRFRRACRKGKVWKSNAMLTALKNAAYGLDRERTRSRGGADGIFLLDRDYRPANEMMRKIFDRFLDKPDPLVAVIAERYGVSPGAMVPVRVVSHHMRLLGVFIDEGSRGRIIIVDFDDTKDR